MLKYIIFICLIFTSSAFSDEGRFILLLGPSGAGKSTIIRHLMEIDSRFTYVSPYTTRELRPGETDKIHVDLETIRDLEKAGKLLTINEIYGIYYATPRDVIDSSIAHGEFPILDWPVDKMDLMLKNYGDKLITVYIEPENLTVLKERLSQDGRDKEGKRFSAGKAELENLHRGRFDRVIDMKIINKSGEDREVASFIHQMLTQ